MTEQSGMTRRSFFKVGSAALAGTAMLRCAGGEDNTKIKEYRTLGRTGFKVSDIALGGLPKDSDVVRYAYDKGVTYFDTAESYGNGEAERAIGGAMQFMDRSKIFITTKIHFPPEETEEQLLDRFSKCLERMKTDYADALYIHAVNDVDHLSHEGFHSAVAKLKADGRLKHAGCSCHGPRGEGPSMETVLSAAVEMNKFDLMLMSYNFMNKEEAENVLALCKAKNIGTTAMKTSPGVVTVDTFDPENPTEEQAEWLKSMEERGMSREQGIERIKNFLKEQEAQIEKTKPFAEKYGVTSNEQLRMVSLQWVLNNPDMHTVCMGLRTFEDWDNYIPLSGTKVNQASLDFLRDFEYAYNGQYCRHGCTTCLASCKNKMPVSTIMRYSYYFAMQGREKHAMSKYASLTDQNGAVCMSCDAPCKGSCPHGVNIQANMVKAHSMLTLV